MKLKITPSGKPYLTEKSAGKQHIGTIPSMYIIIQFHRLCYFIQLFQTFLLINRKISLRLQQIIMQVFVNHNKIKQTSKQRKPSPLTLKKFPQQQALIWKGGVVIQHFHSDMVILRTDYWTQNEIVALGNDGKRGTSLTVTT